MTDYNYQELAASLSRVATAFDVLFDDMAREVQSVAYRIDRFANEILKSNEALMDEFLVIHDW